MSHFFHQIFYVALVIFLMAMPFIGYFVFEKRPFPPITFIAILIMVLGSMYAGLRLCGVHIVGEEGDYIFIVFVYIFWILSGFQLLAIKNKFISKTSFVIAMSPLILIIPYLGWLLFCTLKWFSI